MADPIEEFDIPKTKDSQNSHRWDFLRKFKRQSGESQSSTPELRRARGELIDKILTQGLLSSETLNEQKKDFLSSIDKDTLPFVYGRTFKRPGDYPDQGAFDRYVQHALYNGDNCIVQVLAERPGEHWNTNILYRSSRAEKEAVSKKIFSSFMVVFKSNGANDIGKNEGDATADKIAYLIFPEQILKEYGSSVIKGKNIPVKTVSRKIKRSLSAGDPVDVPDYESAIKEIVNELDSPVWVSGVRLPTEEDLAKKSKA